MKIALLALLLLLTGCSYNHSLKAPAIVNTTVISHSQIENPNAAKEEISAIDVSEQKSSRPAPVSTSISNPSIAPIPSFEIVSGNKRVKPKQTKKANIKTDSGVSDQLMQASTVFAIPSTANISQDIRAQLLINLGRDLDELSSQLTAAGSQIKNKINVSKIVIAKLDAADFEITNITPTEQAISDTDSTEWLWNLRPKRAGNLQVNLSITAVVFVGEKSTAYHIKTYDQVVNIEVTIPQLLTSWLAKYWQWIISTMVLPLIVWAWKMKKKDS